MPDSWLSVWAALRDDSLEQRLRHYSWLSTHAPNIYASRFALLVAEAERRGKPEMVEKAKKWVSWNKTEPLL